MSRNVTTGLRLSPVPLIVGLQEPGHEVGPRLADRGGTERVWTSTRDGSREPHPWTGAAADEFPPDFAELAEARAKGMAIAHVGRGRG